MKIHFTVADLAESRMIANLGPVAAAVFALGMFERHTHMFGQWRNAVRVRLGDRLDRVERLVRERRTPQELLRLIDYQGDASSRRIATTVFEFSRAAVVPYWARARRQLETRRDTLAHLVIARGVMGLLDALHPLAHWNPPVLEVPGEPDRDIHLEGRGLMFSPSLFLDPRTCVLIEPDNDRTEHVLVFPIPFDESTLTEPTDAETGGEQALGALVGHTRAAALQVLADSCTTGELSERLGISLAGASKHATVLRHAGLIATARNRNVALHTLSPLGMALLSKQGTRTTVAASSPRSAGDRRPSIVR